MPVDHVKLPVSDLEASRRFYSAALAPLGYRLVYDGDLSLGWGVGDGGDEDEPFAVALAPPPAVGSHVAFGARSRTQVDEFHAAALAGGGRDNGAPGDRPYGAVYYENAAASGSARQAAPLELAHRRCRPPALVRADEFACGERPSGERPLEE